MPRNTLRAASGQHTESDTVSGVTYNTGGFTVNTNLGRVDEAMVEARGSLYEARFDSVISNNGLVVTVHSQASGDELADDTDLTGENFTYTAYRL